MNKLSDYQKLTTDKLLAGVLETIIKESPILARLSFKNHNGNSLLFNIENEMATVNWYTVGDTWVESANTWAQGSVALKTMGGDVDTDVFSVKTKGDVNDVRQINITGKAKAMAHEFERAFLYGGTTTTPNAQELQGLLLWIANYEDTNLNKTDLDGLVNSQVIANHATSAVLALGKMDELIDAIKPGKPDCLIMDRRTRRYLNEIARTASSSPIRVAQDEFGRFIALYNEIPILINDFQKDNMRNNDGSSVLAIVSYVYATTRASDVDNSFVLAVRFDEQNGICGIQNGAMEHYDFGEIQLETKRAYRNRFAWDCGLVMLGKCCAAVLTGVIDA